MWLSDLSIRQPVFVTMVMIALAVLGIISFTRMGVDLWPDVSFPVVAISTAYPGAGPEEVETSVTDPLEEALRTVAGVEKMRSTSSEGLSVIIMEFYIGYPLDRAAADVRDRVSTAVASLPRDVRDPLIQRFDPDVMPVLTLAVAPKEGDLSPLEVRWIADERIKPRLERIDGVAAVTVQGGLEREIRVDLNLDALQGRGLSPAQVTAALRAHNANVPGGRLTEGSRDVLLRTSGEFRRLEDIGRVVVGTTAGSPPALPGELPVLGRPIPIYLSEVATVRDGFKEVTTQSRLNGREAVALTVQKQSGSNTVQVSRRVKNELSALQREAGLGVTAVWDGASFIEESLNDLIVALLMGALAATVVVFLFFGDLRNTLVTVAGLPVIVMGTLAVMYAVGFTVNMVSMMAISLSIGLLIDDAIVVRENILRHMDAGASPAEAASRGTGEIAFAVLAVTLTLVSVFLPVAFATGIIGMFFKEFGITVAVAVLISLFEAFTLAPMLSAKFFKSRSSPLLLGEGQSEGDPDELPRRPHLFDRVADRYARLLAWALHHRWAVVAGTVAVLLGSFALVPFIGFTFTPTSDAGFFSGSLELPPGTALQESDSVARYIEGVIRDLSEEPDIYASVGSEANPERVSFFIKMPHGVKSRPLLQRAREALADIPGLQFSTDQFNAGGGAAAETVQGRPVQLSVSGDLSLEELDLISQRVLERVKQVPGVVEPDRSFRPGKPELRLDIDRDRAGEMGLSPTAVGEIVRVLWNGETPTKLRQGRTETDITVRLREEDRRRTADILALNLMTPRGAVVPLGSVAHATYASGPARVQRLDGERQVVIGSDFKDRALGDVLNDITAGLEDLGLPPEVRTRWLGDSQQAQEAAASLMFALLLAVIFVYMVLASQFGSFLHPLTIMAALPLSFSGAFIALLTTGKPLDMVAFIGLIMLMGLVTKNSILLVDMILRLRRAGQAREEAILVAGPVRLRPILMTTIAMVAGMSPTALSLGSGSEFRSPMGVTVIGGLITSTLLTLVVVPILYTVLDDLQRLPQRLRSRFRRSPQLPEELPAVRV